MAKPDKIKPISTIHSRYPKILIYGENRTGKSILAGTSPNALILDVDNGTQSAAVKGSTAEKWSISTWDDLTEAYEYLRNEKHGYKWVWLDSGSMMQEVGLNNIMEELVLRKTHRSVYLPDKGEYGENMNRMKRMIRLLTALPVSFGMTAHAMQWEDPATDEVKIWPQITGKNMAPTICSYFGILGYLTVLPPKAGVLRSQLNLQGTESYIAGDRYSITEKGFMRDPTIPKIQKAVDLAFAKLKETAPPPEKPVKATPRKKV